MLAKPGKFPAITHHGAVTGVTGSCHQLHLSDDESLLVDCGMFQGGDDNPEATSSLATFCDPRVRALLITHAHIDHIGRIPDLLQAGFNAPIYASAATIALLPLMLTDAIKIGITRQPQQIRALLQQLERLLVPLPLQQWQALSDLPGIAVRLLPAGHILGSVSFELHITTPTGANRIVFSGDIGCKGTPLLADPVPPERADILVLESTYGNRHHEGRAERQQTLRDIVERCVENRGAVLIPAFAVGRTQELLYEIESIVDQARAQNDTGAWHDLQIILDSPLAAAVTETYQKFQSQWDEAAKQRLQNRRQPLDFSQLHVIDSHSQHLELTSYLRQSAAPCIVIAGSGMCTGGRILNYLEVLLPDPRTDILFVGYQAQGTLGRQLQAQPKTVTINDESVPVRAGIYSLSGYSAHADQPELLDYLAAMSELPKHVVLVHGEADAKQVLATKIRERFDIAVVIPNQTAVTA